MKCVSYKHLDLVPIFNQENRSYGVFSHKKNDRKMRNNKTELIGYIAFHSKARQYTFVPKEGFCFVAETLEIIGQFCHDLNEEKFDFEEEEKEGLL